MCNKYDDLLDENEHYRRAMCEAVGRECHMRNVEELGHILEFKHGK